MQNQPSSGQPLRFYQLQLQQDLLGGWFLIRESGIQGMRGQVKNEHFDLREEAEQRLIHFRDMQLKRGYNIMFCEGAQIESD